MLDENEDFNIFKYQYFYNGGGVAVADYNNDGLEDIFFTGNMVKNRLYLNQGNFKFENITASSGIADHEGWCTGANAVDINNDGWLDIYVCRAAYPFVNLRRNLLFINNKDNTFTESAQGFGIDDPAHSTHSSFFDYDLDGDLDLFLVNHSTPEYSKGNLEIKELKNKTSPETTNKLYQNQDGQFIDVSQEVGIRSNVLSFSLGVATVDLNNDTYPDIYITNDFNEPDHLFVNQGDGTFIESAETWLANQSKFSMGVDFCDLDNNGFQDLITLDMLPEGNFLQKMHLGADNFDKSELFVKQGFQEQYMRNTMQYNTGNNRFIEAGQLAGISNTDWSWSPLFFDFDNDMDNDLFISNGYLKDHTDMDFLQYTSDIIQKLNSTQDEITLEEYVSHMPSILESNYFYKNDGSVFTNNSKQWSIDEKTVSQGAAYGDFDNDGDLDVVVNNSGDYTFVYKNNSQENNWLALSLRGSNKNTFAVGAKVTVYINEKEISQVLQPSRGFQSTSTYRLHFGLADYNRYDSLRIEWADGSIQHENGGACCQEKVISKLTESTSPQSQKITKPIVSKEKIALDFLSNLSSSRDFTSQRLMPFYLSDVSPIIIVDDIDGNGNDDIIISGSENNDLTIFYQEENLSFSKTIVSTRGQLISDIAVADMNNDSKMDLIYSLGGYAYRQQDKKNKVVVLTQNQPRKYSSEEYETGNCNPAKMAIADLDIDGALDIFCGGGYWNGSYPNGTTSCVLWNRNVYEIEEIENIKGVSDVTYCDLNVDGITELITIGHWTSPQIYNYDKKLVNVTKSYVTDSVSGFWNSLNVGDMDGDGDVDILLGNTGLNSQLKASTKNPIRAVINDVDNNGSIDPILGYHIMDDTYPLPSREDLIMQVPRLKKDLLTFKSYAELNFESLLEILDLENPEMLTVDTLANLLLISDSQKLKNVPLPQTLQRFPIYTQSHFSIGDIHYNYIAGNKRNNLVKIGNLDGSLGELLQIKDNSALVLNNLESGLDIRGEQRSSNIIEVGNKYYLVICPIGESLQLLRINS